MARINQVTFRGVRGEKDAWQLIRSTLESIERGASMHCLRWDGPMDRPTAVHHVRLGVTIALEYR